MKFLKPPFSFKRSFARTLSRSWNRWQIFQFRHSRWILFWTLKGIREHYRLWRMRSQIMKLWHRGTEIKVTKAIPKQSNEHR